ncbi:MAG: putative glycosyltransferase [uncultured marine phage]|uniref:Putative glycosyltransferase n=1 Tax=uncultured marine phage TaxID=707152 RepID=A0A8D9FRG5_9VIRU|nr:MAG: putative glycosyltransferase [uncultured marine phage]
MNNSIVFIHKSNVKDSVQKQSFIKTVLECAQHFNPEKKIIFIGDNHNEQFAVGDNVIFKNMDKMGKSHEYFTKFNSRFRSVRGRNAPFNDLMIKFFFERFIYMYMVMEEYGMDSYWTFDTDTLIIDDLTKHESKFQDYDCTSQCNAMCLNGFVKTETLRKYVEHIIDLFDDKDYLEENQREFDTIHPGYALTEMRFYAHFKNNTDLNSIDLSTPINGETFDHCLKQNLGPNRDSENTWESQDGMKKIYEKEDGLYFKFDDNFVKVITMNLSWMGNDAFTSLFEKSKKSQ